jgi:two-component system, NarL family, nitrate/nitrite response regulator NarL
MSDLVPLTHDAVAGLPDGGETPARVLIVDDHAMVRAGLRMLIQQEPGRRVVGEANDLATSRALAANVHPDVILLDLDLNGDNGLDLLPVLLAGSNRPRVLVLTASRDSSAHREAMRRGASGVLVKDKAGDVLIKAIQKVRAGEVWLDRVTLGEVLSDLGKGPEAQGRDPEQLKIATLSEREREVLSLIAQGHKNHEIAERLFISGHTVRHHVSAIFAKLGVSDRLELALYAYRHRLAKPPE